jgi:hypothetical protein
MRYLVKDAQHLSLWPSRAKTLRMGQLRGLQRG